MRFAGRAAIVTGGCGEIGLATARVLGRDGARVLLADVSAEGERIAATLRREGVEVEYVRADVSCEQEVAQAVERALDRWGRLDIMVANAGVSGRGTAESLPVQDWQRVLAINLTGVYLCIRHAVPAMRRSGGGSIVITGSVMGLVGHADALPYASTKGALVNLARAASLDHARDGIRVNAVCPGYMERPTIVGGAAARAAHDEDLLAKHPIGRLGRPADVAAAIAFLASDEASFITGTSLVVDGGYTAQ